MGQHFDHSTWRYCYNGAMILVVGSTGVMGSEIVTISRRAGLPVRALARPTGAPERLNAIRASGAELVWGDLKDPESLATACSGVEAVISTASSTLSRQPGDSIQTVDHDGQLSLVNAARHAGVSHFTFFGVGHRFGNSPLIDAKQGFERAVRESGIRWTNFEGTPFMEVWLSPARLVSTTPSGRPLFSGPATMPSLGFLCSTWLRPQ